MATQAPFTSTLLEHYARYEEYGGLDYDPHDNPIRNWLRYRLRAGEVHADASLKAVEMYRELWGVEAWKIADLGSMDVTGETMCSFWTTYKQSLVLGAQEKLRELLGKPKVTWARGVGLGILQDLFIHFDDEGFNEVHSNKELQRFAQLTHCLGNMIIVPQGFNGARNKLAVQEKDYTYDYWDLSLEFLLHSEPPAHLEDYKSNFLRILRHYGLERLGLTLWFREGVDVEALTSDDVELLPGHEYANRSTRYWQLPRASSLRNSLSELEIMVREINRRIEYRANMLEKASRSSCY